MDAYRISIPIATSFIEQKHAFQTIALQISISQSVDDRLVSWIVKCIVATDEQSAMSVGIADQTLKEMQHGSGRAAAAEAHCVRATAE